MTTAYWAESRHCEDLEHDQHDWHNERPIDKAVRLPSRQVRPSIAISIPNMVGFLNAMRKKARFAAVMGKLAMLRAFATELFHGDIHIAVEEDPDIGDEQYLVFSVEMRDSLEEVARRRREWYNLTGGLLGSDCELVQLVIAVLE